jgi:hypothetical protein
MEKKGIEVEYMFLLGGLVLILLLFHTDRWECLLPPKTGRAKSPTATQVKNVILLMKQIESKPACGYSCDKIAIQQRVCRDMGKTSI